MAAAGSVRVEKLMEVERYSHVMHISSTVTGRLAPGLDSWDALRAALPAGTVSGAPKARAARPHRPLLRGAPERPAAGSPPPPWTVVCWDSVRTSC